MRLERALGLSGCHEPLVTAGLPTEYDPPNAERQGVGNSPGGLLVLAGSILMSRDTYFSASRRWSQCQIRCQIRGFEGNGGDRNSKGVSTTDSHRPSGGFESFAAREQTLHDEQQ